MNNGELFILKLFVLTWFCSGFIGMIATWIFDMRNKEFNENYFDISGIFCSLLILFFGYVTLFLSIGLYCCKYKPFTKLIYKIANIGIKNPKKNIN